MKKIILILALIVVLFSAGCIGGETKHFTAGSKSMYPTIDVGDKVIVEKQESYNPGDIIVFQGWEENPIIARIVATCEDSKIKRWKDWDEMTDKELIRYRGKRIYITKGDNNPNCDQCLGKEPLTDSDIIGKVVEIK